MTEQSRAEDLRQRLRADLAARLEPEGWHELGSGTDGIHLTVFRKALNPDFIMMVEVLHERSWPDRPPVVVDDVIAGVSYEPVRRLYPLLGKFEYAVVRGAFGPEREHDDNENDDDAEREDDDEDDGAWESDHFEVRAEADVPSVAEQLAELVKEHAQSFGDKIATVDVLLNQLRDSAAEYFDVRRAAVLAAAGRYGEASPALDRLKPDRTPTTGQQRIEPRGNCDVGSTAVAIRR